VNGFGTSWSVDRAVISEAGRLREQSIGFRKQGQDDTVICVPDAIHLATANLAVCSRFFTFDNEGRHGCYGLLPFDRRLAGFAPRIIKPGVDATARPRRLAPSVAELVQEHPSLFGGLNDEAEPTQITAEAAGAEGNEGAEARAGGAEPDAGSPPEDEYVDLSDLIADEDEDEDEPPEEPRLALNPAPEAPPAQPEAGDSA
jgi:hypothetical protein